MFEKEKTCRTCTKTDIKLVSVFVKQDIFNGICYSDMIKECTMHTIQKNDELPQHICLECTDKVRNSYYFKRQCDESHKILLSLVETVKQAAATSKVSSHPEEGLIEQKNKEPIQRKKSRRNISIKTYQCGKCDQHFDDADKYSEHENTAHKPPRHTCPNCSKEFIRLGHLTRHLIKVHKKDGDHEEDNIPQMVVVKSEIEINDEPPISVEKNLETEVVVNEAELNFQSASENDDNHSYRPGSESLNSFKDENETFENKVEPNEAAGKLKKEIEEASIKDEPSCSTKEDYIEYGRRFKCEKCHKAFKRKSHLKQHALCHTKLKPYECEVCNKKFTRQDNLKVHMANHGQKNFQCDICDCSFGQSYLLKRHKNQKHNDEKSFLCSACGQRFARKADLAVHMRRHTGEKPYKCQYCNKGFTRSTEVYVHERYHTGEKKHVCSICGKAFQRPYNLLVHVRTHTGERPYQCSYCPKNFAQCSDLKAHIRRHTGERYRCDECGKGFIHVFVLNHHKLSVHGIQVESRIKRIAKVDTGTQ